MNLRVLLQRIAPYTPSCTRLHDWCFLFCRRRRRRRQGGIRTHVGIRRVVGHRRALEPLAQDSQLRAIFIDTDICAAHPAFAVEGGAAV